MNTADVFPGSIEGLGSFSFALFGPPITEVPPILIMEGRIDQNRLLSDIDAEFFIHVNHSRQSFFHRSFPMKDIDHRRIEPDGLTVQGIDALVLFLALANNGSCHHISRF